MIRRGIAPLDDLLGGTDAGASHLLTGGPGSGKTTCALALALAVLRRGGRVAMLASGRAADLKAHARHLGGDLRPFLADERLLMLRYRDDYARRLAHALSAERVVEDLRRLVARHEPDALIVDGIAPLLDDAAATAAPAAALAELLVKSRAMALLTYAADIAAGYDRRLEPLVQHVTSIVRLTNDGGGLHRADVITVRGAPVRAERAWFVVTKGAGLVAAPAPVPAAIAAPAPRLADETPPVARGPMLFVHTTAEPAEDLVVAVRAQGEVLVRRAAERAPSGAAPAALIVETDHASLGDARALVRQWHGAESAPPILVAVRFNLRSIDRARLLRDGADDVIAGDMGAPELRQRLAGALHRGHLSVAPLAVQDDERATQRALGGSDDVLLAREAFVRAVSAHAAHDDAAPFAMVRLVPVKPGDLAALGDAALGTMRVASGDLAGIVDEGIAVYLLGAARRDVAPFLDRLRARWPAARGAFRAEIACHPVDARAVRQLLAPQQVS